MSLLSRPLDPTTERQVLPWILRIGIAGCFIGHGAFGVITKSAWLPYFAVAGIGEELAWALMPIVGFMDIGMGLLVLIWPCRALLLWAAFWTVWTALLRPFSGEPFWETLERAGNYGVPIAFLCVVGVGGPLCQRLVQPWPPFTAQQRLKLAWALRLTTVTLLVGHAGLGLFAHKAGLAQHYGALGLPNPVGAVPFVGAFEFMLAALVLIRPAPGLLVGVALWKMVSESLFMVAGASWWEFIERFGSYAAPFALAVLMLRDFPSTRGATAPPPS